MESKCKVKTKVKIVTSCYRCTRLRFVLFTIDRRSAIETRMETLGIDKVTDQHW
jgi:hypothetical protein